MCRAAPDGRSRLRPRLVLSLKASSRSPCFVRSSPKRAQPSGRRLCGQADRGESGEREPIGFEPCLHSVEVPPRLRCSPIPADKREQTLLARGPASIGSRRPATPSTRAKPIAFLAKIRIERALSIHIWCVADMPGARIARSDTPRRAASRPMNRFDIDSMRDGPTPKMSPAMRRQHRDDRRALAGKPNGPRRHAAPRFPRMLARRHRLKTRGAIQDLLGHGCVWTRNRRFD